MKQRAALAGKLHSLRRDLCVRFAASSALRLAAQCAAAFGACFFLAGIRLLGRSVPAALALLAAMPFSLAAVCSFFGAVCGYLAFWGAAGVFEPAAAGFLILAELCIFSDLLPRDRKWFPPASACTLYALIGTLSLLSGGAQGREIVFFCARLLLLAVCTAVFSAALHEKSRSARGLLALFLLAGCSAVRLPGGIPLSAVLASGAVFLALSGADALLTAAACGLALDLTCGAEPSMTAVFSLAALVCRTPFLSSRIPRAAAFLVCCLSAVLFSGGAGLAMLAGAFLGVLLALAAPQSLRQSLDERQSAALDARLSELRRACDLLNEIGSALDRARIRDPGPQSAAVFDSAAETLCQSCGHYRDCWETHAAETYRSLSGAASRILQRGAAERSDLPEAFLARCRCPDGFLAAVNDALDSHRLRLQCQSRLAESRAVVADQYRFLARLLQAAVERPEPSAVPPVFTPDLGFRARGVRGASVSGDHGSCFTCGEWYYVLLCDGMGTGEEASRESAGAIHVLSELIAAGFEPQDAMQMLGGVYLLRGDAGFSTVDLLQVSLVTGEGFLHKWGAAPSYLKLARRTCKLGSPSPPGVAGGSRLRPQCMRVSLGGGEMLLMLSDGVDAAQAERLLRDYTGRSPRELASGVLACGGDDTDDRTAVALCLRRSPARKKRGASRERILSRFRV